jgi:single-strand DNA-binding protein
MNSINLIGRLTRDPESDHTAGGTSVCRIRLAVPRRKKEGKDQGAVFVNIVAYGAQATAASEYLTKGRQVAVSGRLEYREWTGQDGSPHSVHEVVADHLKFLAQPSGVHAGPDGPPEPEADESGETR